MTARLILPALLLAGLASAPSAQPEPGDPRGPAEAVEPGGPLRAALRDYYVHALLEELDVAPERHARVTPLVEDLLAAQRDAARSRLEAVRTLGDLLAQPEPPEDRLRDLMRGLESAELEGRESVASARAALLRELDPRQAARFVAFEEDFRARVRAMASRREPGQGPAREGAGPRHRPPPGRGGRLRMPPPPDGDDRQPMDGSDRRPVDGSDRRPEADTPPPPGRPEPPEALLDTVGILFVHELRQRLDLSPQRTLELMPAVEDLLRAQVEPRRRHREAMRRLREAADDPSRSDASLHELVMAVLKAEADLPGAAASARQAVLGRLSPHEGARFLLLEQRFFREARRRLQGVGEPEPGQRPGPRTPVRQP